MEPNQFLVCGFFDPFDVLRYALIHGLLLESTILFPNVSMNLRFHEIFMNCSQCNVLKIEDFLVKQ